jgi:hypothetical protein
VKRKTGFPIIVQWVKYVSVGFRKQVKPGRTINKRGICGEVSEKRPKMHRFDAKTMELALNSIRHVSSDIETRNTINADGDRCKKGNACKKSV